MLTWSVKQFFAGTIIFLRVLSIWDRFLINIICFPRIFCPYLLGLILFSALDNKHGTEMICQWWATQAVQLLSKVLNLMARAHLRINWPHFYVNDKFRNSWYLVFNLPNLIFICIYWTIIYHSQTKRWSVHVIVLTWPPKFVAFLIYQIELLFN